MFGLFRRLLFGQPKLIFRYRVDGRTRYDDPLAIDARLIEAGGDAWRATFDDVYRLNRPMSAEMAATLGEDEVKRHREKFDAGVRNLIAWSRSAFELPELDRDTGRGCTGGECIDVLLQYLEFARLLEGETRPLA